jgi:hypothetical protein
VTIVRSLSVVLLAVALIAPFTLTDCGNDSASPEDHGPATFARMMGSTPNGLTIVGDAAVTSDGLSVVIGSFLGHLHVTGSADSLASGNAMRPFLAAFRPDGSLAWKTTTAGGGGAPTFQRMVRDPNDNLLVVGSYDHNLEFGSTALVNAGGTGIFVAKLDKNAGVAWALGASASGGDRGVDIAAAADGSMYVAGLASTELSVAGTDVGELGSYSGFVVKILGNGVGAWGATATGAGASICSGVTVSQDGSVVVCGYYDDSAVQFAGDTLPLDGNSDDFIARFGADGTPMGAIRIGGAGNSRIEKVTTLDNEPVVTGRFDGTVDFDVNTAGGSVTASGGLNAFVARYSKAGELRWVKTFGPGTEQFGLSICRIDVGHLLVCGIFTGSITLGSKTLTPAGSSDVFFARMDGNGKVLFAGQLGGTDTEDSVSATATGSTAVIVGGTGSQEVLFPNGTHLKKFGAGDGFLYQQP